jgi:hypothetical protein
VKKPKRKTKPVPLNKMTRKQLLSQLRKVKRACAAKVNDAQRHAQYAVDKARDNAFAEYNARMKNMQEQIAQAESVQRTLQHRIHQLTKQLLI